MIERSAPGMTAFEVSKTVPEMVPPTTCEYKGMNPRGASIHRTDTTPTKIFPDLIRIMLPLSVSFVFGMVVPGLQRRLRVRNGKSRTPIAPSIPRVSLVSKSKRWRRESRECCAASY
jgi:hypothetical protein